MKIALYVLAVIFGALVCAFGNRIRGGLWGQQIAKHVHWGSTTARIVAWGGSGAIAAHTAALFTGGPWIMPLLVIPLFWLGSCCPMFKSIDLGRQDGTFWGDVGGLTAHGIISMTPAVIMLHALGYCIVPLSLASFLIAPAYILAYKMKWSPAYLGVYPDDRPPLGELLYGACVGAGTTMTFLIGSH